MLAFKNPEFPLAREFAVIEPRDSTYQLQETSGP
jgi:hypothetical protein